MNILITGGEQRINELKEKLPKEANIAIAGDIKGIELIKHDFIFDLNFDDDAGNLQYYASLKDRPVIVGAVKKQLVSVASRFREKINCRLIGMNTLPTFIHRSKVECSLLNQEGKKTVEIIGQKLGWEILVVQDRVGMVTPRVVFMIINEACYTLQEGTAKIQDIDLGMKLGTNYPYGPFEWADKIGIKDVYETLSAIYEDTGDERYKICPLLKTKYLKKESFY